MTLRAHAETELAAIGYDIADTTDGPNKWICDSILELLDVFRKQGHSGSSAPHVVGLFTKLALYEPLGPITGSDGEWIEVGEGMLQNRRCSHVFKDLASGRVYDINARIYREPNGSCYTNLDSSVDITFPYTPTREYIDVPESGHDRRGCRIEILPMKGGQHVNQREATDCGDERHERHIDHGHQLRHKPHGFTAAECAVIAQRRTDSRSDPDMNAIDKLRRALRVTNDLLPLAMDAARSAGDLELLGRIAVRHAFNVELLE